MNLLITDLHSATPCHFTWFGNEQNSTILVFFKTCIKGECADNPKTEYDSLTNTCNDVNECDRWLKPDGAEKDLYTLYEEALRAGGAGTTEWNAIVTNEASVYDKNNILFDAVAGSATKHIIAKGAPHNMLCANAAAQPSIGTATYDTAKSYNLKECFCSKYNCRDFAFYNWI